MAFASIVYFALFKGLKSSGLISVEFMNMVHDHLWLSLLVLWLMCSAVMALFQHVLRINILRVTILVGTFSLAMAFAGNDLVNFIGVPMAGYDGYLLASASPEGASTMMGRLMEPVQMNYVFMLIAGAIMVITLWKSKKAQSVTDTEINLAKQDDGPERFGSTMMSRSMVRAAIQTNKAVEKAIPRSVLRFLDRRFLPLRPTEEEARHKAPFDMIRATVNLTVASILISIATQMRIPLSTTYVTFMVAMSTSLADRAWGRESAVYRITGVLTVISGCFVTAIVATALGFGVTLLLMWGGVIAVAAMVVLCIYIFIHSNRVHKKHRETKHIESVHDNKKHTREAAEIVNACIADVSGTMYKATEIYKETIVGIFNEDRRVLRKTVRDSNELFYAARERKYEVMPTLQKLQYHYIEHGYYYVQVVDYMSEMTKALVHITRPSFEHINNHHEGLSKEQVNDLMGINNEVSAIYDHINTMLSTNDFEEIDRVMRMRDQLFEAIDDAIKNQLRRIKSKQSSTKTSMLYLNILNETKNMVLQSRNLLKSQKYFIEKN